MAAHAPILVRDDVRGLTLDSVFPAPNGLTGKGTALTKVTKLKGRSIARRREYSSRKKREKGKEGRTSKSTTRTEANLTKRIQQQKEERERERRKNEQKYNKNRSKFYKEKYSTKEKNHESKSDLKKKPKREKHWTLEYIWSVHEEWVNSYISWISALIFQYVTDAASVLLKSINWIFLYVWSAVESTYLYFHCICERTDAF